MVGVMTIGVLPGVLLAVGLSLLKLIRMASHPNDAVLGPVIGKTGVYAENVNGNGKSVPGLVIYRFDSALLFFNSDYFKDRVRSVISNAEADDKWFLLDAEAMSVVDITGTDALDDLRRELAGQGIVLAIARSKGIFRVMLDRTGVAERIGAAYLFPTVHDGVEAFRSLNGNVRRKIAGNK
jgi:MFS superfamily sulfate permease-like transporter